MTSPYKPDVVESGVACAFSITVSSHSTARALTGVEGDLARLRRRFCSHVAKVE